jgi:hypothetical protein
MNNHAIAKCWKIMSFYRKVMETRKNPRHEDPSSHEERSKGKKTWKRKNHCTHCNKVGHQEATCWTLHPELRSKKRKKVGPTLMKGLADEETKKGSQLPEEGQLPEKR